MTTPPLAKGEGQRRREHKIVVLGSEAVGKTSMIMRFIYGQDISEMPYDPTGEDLYRKICNIEETAHLLQIEDSFSRSTSHTSALQDLQIANADAVVLMYSVTGRGSFKDVEGIRDEVARVRRLKGLDGAPPMVLVGNKVDTRQEEERYKGKLKAEEPNDRPDRKGAGTVDQSSSSPVTYQEGEEIAKQWGCPFVEISAKDGTNVETAFFNVVREITGKKREVDKKVEDEANELKLPKRGLIDYLRYGQGKLKDGKGSASKKNMVEALERKRSNNP
jgi:GTPase KRas protein